MNRHSHRSIGEIVDAQVRAWDIERMRSREAPTNRALPTPCIAISRELGAGGAEIGKILAATLGLRVWDHEIVHAIATESGVRESLLDSLDEHARSSLVEFLGALSGHDEPALAYATRLGTVLRTVAHHGKAVLIGRGAQFLVPRERALHVRIVAPEALRVRAVAARLGLDAAAAEKLTADTERERRAFHMRHFGADGSDPGLYDLVINRAGLSFAGAAVVIVAAYRERFASGS
jgi:cytidylate kinase